MKQCESLLLILLYSIAVSALSQIIVDPSTHKFLDSDGRTRIFHGKSIQPSPIHSSFQGVNVVQKWQPFYPTTLLSPEKIKNLASWGFTAVRLGVMWQGTEPIRGQYNESYLQELELLVKSLESSGIYTILDSHQDLYSPKFCGDGAPDWAVIPSNSSPAFALPIDNKMDIDPHTGYPINCSANPWPTYYLAGQTASAFQSLYDNVDGIQDSFIQYWKKIASTFKSYTSVLGYDLINEPFAGDIYSNPKLLLPAIPDGVNLEPMYDKLNEGIREVDQEHLIFYEPVTWDLTPSGFTYVPGGPKFVNRSVLSYHYYCWIFDDHMNPIDWLACDFTEVDMFEVRDQDVKRLGGGKFLTEFGLCNGETEDGSMECVDVMNTADSHLESWTYWDYSDGAVYNSSDLPQIKTVSILSRTYAYAIAGNPVQMSYDQSTKAFVLTYNIKKSCKQPTEIYLNEDMHYSSGYSVSLQPAGIASWTSPRKNIIYVEHLSSSQDGQQLQVYINQK